MPTLLEHGGDVELWAGWTIGLPSSYHQRNSDGSWSCWGSDWAVDVHIIEIAGDETGAPVSPEKLLGIDRKINAVGAGGVGVTEVLKEIDSGREVFRLAGSLAAENTTMSCWVSYFTEQQLPFAEDFIRKVVHHAPSAA
ncbi:MAG: hypothetical protein IPP88_15855 [Betaproteobacteria bacterium]|nr:hypothetical protein [Betaproteobacteria bacterium]